MLDIKFLRENPEIVKENIRKKFQDHKLPMVDEVIALDLESRKKDFNWKFDGSKYPRFLNLFVKNVGSMAHGGIWE